MTPWNLSYTLCPGTGAISVAPSTGHLRKLDFKSFERKNQKRSLLGRAGLDRAEAPLYGRLQYWERPQRWKDTYHSSWTHLGPQTAQRKDPGGGGLSGPKEGWAWRKGNQMNFTHLEITVEEQEPTARTNTKEIWRVVSSLLVCSSATFFPTLCLQV